MKTKPLSSRIQNPRAGSKKTKTRDSFLVIFVLLIAISVTEASLGCSSDSQCRRDVCVFTSCVPRPTTGGTCQLDTHCVKSTTDSCINKKCATKSLTGGACDSPGDCAYTADQCTGEKCAFSPALMVWDGNPAPLNKDATFTPSVAVNGILFVFEGYVDGATNTRVEAYDPVAKTWSSKTGLDAAVYGFSVVAVGTNVFLIGGTLGNAAATTFFVYDTVTDQWDKTWDQLPEARYGFAAAAMDSTLFIFGGQSSSGIRLDSIRSLDVSAKGKGWNLLTATLPTPTTSFSATTVGQEIFLTGGTTSTVVNTVLKYNARTPNTNPVPINPMIQARTGHTSFFDPTSKRLFVMGSVSGIDAVEYLDLTVDSSGSWKSANALNSATIVTSSGGLIGSLFHVISGGSLQILDVSVPSSVKWSPFPNSPAPFSTVVQKTGPTKITAVDTSSQNQKASSFYDISTNTWTAGASSAKYPGQSVDYPSSAVVNGELYVVGDIGGRGAPSAVYALNAAGDTWTRKDNMLAIRVRGCAAASGTDIYLYGGATSDAGTPTSTLYKMDTTKAVGSGQWSLITPVSGSATAVTNCAAVVVGQKLLIFGGGTGAQGTSTTGLVQSFDIPSKSWDSALPNPITPRSHHSIVFLKGFVFVIGGSSTGGGSFLPPLAKVEVFDVNTKTVSVIKDMPTPRYLLGSVTDGTSIFSVEGTTFYGYFPSLEKLRNP